MMLKLSGLWRMFLSCGGGDNADTINDDYCVFSIIACSNMTRL